MTPLEIKEMANLWRMCHMPRKWPTNNFDDSFYLPAMGYYIDRTDEQLAEYSFPDHLDAMISGALPSEL